MTTTVLAYFPSPGQGVWYLGPFPIRAYALCIIAGIFAALVIGDRRWVARGGERGVIYDVAFWAVPFGLIGGRLYHVLTDWKTYFGPGGAGPMAALKIWEGGLGIWGAVALGAVGAWIGCRRKGIPLPAFGDAVAPGIVLAQAIGRLGNYFNQELYGRETTVPWGMEVFYRRDASGVVDVHSLDGVSTGEVAAVVHPTFLYELLWNLLVFLLLIWADRKFRLGHGRLFALYVAAYCVGRFWVELMRDDTATHIAGIRINVFTAAFVFIGAVVYLLLAPKGREDPETLRGWVDVEEDDEEKSVADEWAGDLVAAAKGSGLLAAATVAGEHETEDAAVVGDTEIIEPVLVDEAEAQDDEDAGAEAEVAEVEAVEAGDSDDATVIVYAGEHDSEGASDEAVVIVESADEGADDAETVVVDHEVVGAETVVVDEHLDAEADVDEADTDEADTVVVDHEVVGAETVIVESHADSDPDPDPDLEPEAEPESGPDTELTVQEADAVLVEHVTAEAEESAEVVVAEESAEVVVAEESVEVVVAEESAAEPAQEPAAEGTGEPAPEVAAAAGDAEDPKLGSTLKRLLWGAGNRGGK